MHEKTFLVSRLILSAIYFHRIQRKWSGIRSVPSLSHVQLFATAWIAARQASLSNTNSWSSLKLTSIESVMPSCHLILYCPLLLLPPNPPSIRVFPMSQFFAPGGQSIRLSASPWLLPMNTQDWFPSEWTAWISLQSKGLSRVFSDTTVQRHHFLGAQLSSQSNSHIHIAVKSFSRVRLFVTPWTVAYWAPPSMGFSRQEYWNGLPFLFSKFH